MRSRTLLSFGNFFSVAHFYLIIYIIGPYLATFLPADETGLIISAGALATLAIFPSAPRLVAMLGARRLAFICGAAEAIVLILLAYNPLPVLAIVFVAIGCAISPLIAYGLDLLLEATVARTEEANTGRIRTAFLTTGNVALIIAPVVAGFLLGDTDAYSRVFLVAAASLIPFLILFGVWDMPEGTIPIESDVRRAWMRVRKSRDLRSIMFANFLLQFFYHTAPLYIPLYLHDVLQIPWSSLGWMFAVMLLPFVLIEYPAGAAADRFLGDRALLGAGFVIMGVSFAFVGFLGAATSFLITLTILVASRVGSALVESMAEGHFFRRVSEIDTDLVSVFRSARPLAALCAPLIGSILLGTVGYKWLFIVVGAMVLVLGVQATAGIKEIKTGGPP